MNNYKMEVSIDEIVIADFEKIFEKIDSDLKEKNNQKETIYYQDNGLSNKEKNFFMENQNLFFNIINQYINSDEIKIHSLPLSKRDLTFCMENKETFLKILNYIKSALIWSEKNK